jgi:hypothetical protein
MEFYTTRVKWKEIILGTKIQIQPYYMDEKHILLKRQSRPNNN